MKLNEVAGVILGTALAMACAAAPPVSAPAPANPVGSTPAQPTPAAAPTFPARPAAPKRTAWTFAYVPGSYMYTLTTDATVAPVSDTTLKRPIPELIQTTVIAIDSTGALQIIRPLAATTPTACDANAALITRAQQLIPRIPNELTIGNKWRDSTSTNGCRGMIPAESTVISNYVVVGDTTMFNATLLHIQRVDSLSATGEGADGQHRILITATGTGTADILFDVAAGRMTTLHGTQTTLVNVTTSGRLTQFLQHITELATLSGLQ